MSDSQNKVIKWIGSVVATILSGTIVWHLTEGIKPADRTLESSPPPPESKKTKSPSPEQIPSPSPKPIPLSKETSQPALLSPSTQMSPSPVTERWKFMGVSTKTGEETYIDNSSISKSTSTIRFTYKIGNDLIIASASCDSNRWYAKNKNTDEDYGWISPQSQATQDMMNYVCKS